MIAKMEVVDCAKDTDVGVSYLVRFGIHHGVGWLLMMILLVPLIGLGLYLVAVVDPIVGLLVLAAAALLFFLMRKGQLTMAPPMVMRSLSVKTKKWQR